MNDYIEAICIGKPMDLPEYNEDTELWEVYFEESPTPWNPYAERDIIAVPMESSEEACEVYNHYNQNPVTEEKEDDEDNQDDQELV